MNRWMLVFSTGTQQLALNKYATIRGQANKWWVLLLLHWLDCVTIHRCSNIIFVHPSTGMAKSVWSCIQRINMQMTKLLIACSWHLRDWLYCQLLAILTLWESGMQLVDHKFRLLFFIKQINQNKMDCFAKKIFGDQAARQKQAHYKTTATENLWRVVWSRVRIIAQSISIIIVGKPIDG